LRRLLNARRREARSRVIGLGCIGLPTAAIIARANCQVTGIDVSDHVVDTINRGEIHIEEVDLDGLVQGVVQRGTLRASTQIVPADVFVIAVPTPFEKDGQHTPDTSYVMAAATEVAGVLKKSDTIILESTCPVGTTEAMRDLIAGLRPDLKLPGQTAETPDVSIAYCPERVLPGKILEELAHNDRSIGGITPRCVRKALAFRANIDDFRESPARFIAASLAREFGERVQIVEPYAGELPREFEGTGAALVGHDVFKAVPAEERSHALIYDTRGIWPDARYSAGQIGLRLAS